MKKGFTLIELLVAITVFMVVIFVVLGLFVASLKAQRKVLAQQNIQDNARYLMGFIAKELRMSEIDSVSPTVLNITRYGEVQNGVSVVYSFASNGIYRDGELINSNEVNITGRFYDSGVGADGEQARITIAIKIETISDKPEEEAEVNIQTTLSQRNLDI